MSTLEPRRRGKAGASATTERLSQSVSDIEFDPNETPYRSNARPGTKQKQPPRSSSREPSRGVRNHRSNERIEDLGLIKTVTATAVSDTKQSQRNGRPKKPSSLQEGSNNANNKNADWHASAVSAMSTSTASIVKSDDNQIKSSRRKRPTDDSMNPTAAPKDNMSQSRTSLNASKASLDYKSASKESSRQRRRSKSPNKASSSSTQRRSSSRSKTSNTTRTPQQDSSLPPSDHNGRSSSRPSSRRDRSSSRESHHRHHHKSSSSLPAADKSRRSEKQIATGTTAAPTRRSANQNTATMAVPVKSLSNKLYDFDRPQQHSIVKKSIHSDDVSIQSNNNPLQRVMTKEQRAWKGIDDILDDDDDHASSATRDVLPEAVAKAMQQERLSNNAIPALMNASFSSIQTEMTSLTLSTTVTSAKNYVVQPVEANNDPLQAFLGSIAENLVAESGDADEQKDTTLLYNNELSANATTNHIDNLNNTTRSQSTESSAESADIQEYYAGKGSNTQHLQQHESSDDDEDEDRYNSTIQAYGRASMPPRKPNQSKSVDGYSIVDNMPALLDSSFSSLQSELTDIQSIISTAKNFVVKDKAPEDDDPMSAFLGRITNGLQARQMLIEEEGINDDSSSHDCERQTEVVAYQDEATDEPDDEEDDDEHFENDHIPAEDELSGAGSIPDKDDLSGADEEAEETSESDHEEDEDEDEEFSEDLEEPENDARMYPVPPDTPGGLSSIPSLSSVSTVNTHQLSQVDDSADPLARWAANLRQELAQVMAENRAPSAEEEELAEMEKALARAAQIAAQEKNETDITRVALDDEVIKSVEEESEKARATSVNNARNKKVKKRAPAGAAGNADVGSNGDQVGTSGRPRPGRRKVMKKKKLPVQPLPAPAEEPENFSAMFKEEQKPEVVARHKQSMPVAAVKAVAKAALPISKQSKKEKYEQKSTLKNLRAMFQKLSFRRGKPSRRNSATSAGGDEGKYFPRENQEEDDDEEANFL
jgi:hypothetical protein